MEGASSKAMMPSFRALVMCFIVWCSVCCISTAFNVAGGVSWLKRRASLGKPSFRSSIESTKLFSRPPDRKWTLVPDDAVIDDETGDITTYMNDYFHAIPQNKTKTADEIEREEMEEWFARDEREEFKISGFYKEDPSAEVVPPLQVDVNVLKEEWVQHCADQNQSEKANEFSIAAALPLLNLTNANQTVQLFNATLEAENEQKSVTYISEEELKRLWIRNSHKTTGKPLSQFNIAEALLLLQDEEDTEFVAEEEKEGAFDDEEDEVEEVIVTQKVRPVRYAYILLF